MLTIDQVEWLCNHHGCRPIQPFYLITGVVNHPLNQTHQGGKRFPLIAMIFHEVLHDKYLDVIFHKLLSIIFNRVIINTDFSEYDVDLLFSKSAS